MLLDFADLTPKCCVNAEKKNLSLEGCTFSLGLVLCFPAEQGSCEAVGGVMDGLSGCGNVLYLLILHAETYHRVRYSHNSKGREEGRSSDS